MQRETDLEIKLPCSRMGGIFFCFVRGSMGLHTLWVILFKEMVTGCVILLHTRDACWQLWCSQDRWQFYRYLLHSQWYVGNDIRSIKSERVQKIHAWGYIGMMSDHVSGAEILKTIYLCDDAWKCLDYCPCDSSIKLLAAESKAKHELNNKASRSHGLSSCCSEVYEICWQNRQILTPDVAPSLKETSQPLRASWSLWAHSF